MNPRVVSAGGDCVTSKGDFDTRPDADEPTKAIHRIQRRQNLLPAGAAPIAARMNAKCARTRTTTTAPAQSEIRASRPDQLREPASTRLGRRPDRAAWAYSTRPSRDGMFPQHRTRLFIQSSGSCISDRGEDRSAPLPTLRGAIRLESKGHGCPIPAAAGPSLARHRLELH